MLAPRPVDLQEQIVVHQIATTVAALQLRQLLSTDKVLSTVRMLLSMDNHPQSYLPEMEARARVASWASFLARPVVAVLLVPSKATVDTPSKDTSRVLLRDSTDTPHKPDTWVKAVDTRNKATVATSNNQRNRAWVPVVPLLSVLVVVCLVVCCLPMQWRIMTRTNTTKA